MFKDKLKTAKCFDQADLVGHVQVMSISFISLKKKAKKKNSYGSGQT